MSPSPPTSTSVQTLRKKLSVFSVTYPHKHMLAFLKLLECVNAFTHTHAHIYERNNTRIIFILTLHWKPELAADRFLLIRTPCKECSKPNIVQQPAQMNSRRHCKHSYLRADHVFTDLLAKPHTKPGQKLPLSENFMVAGTHFSWMERLTK